MKKWNVLVYPAGTEIGLEIARSLSFSTHFNLIGANSLHDHSDIIFSNLIADLPSVDNKEALIGEIQRLVRELEIDILFPAHDEVMELFSSTSFAPTKVIAPTPEAAKALRYKSATYDALRGVSFLPKIIHQGNAEQTPLPLFARPDRGQGSVGVFKITAPEQLLQCWEGERAYIVTEFLPGAEYTVDCYTSRDGKLQYLCARERQRIRNGICVRAAEQDPAEFLPIAEEITSRIPVRGPWFFQVKRDVDGVLRLMEVANRVAGTMGFERLKGVNLVQSILWETLGYSIALPKVPVATFIYDRALYEGIKISEPLEHLYVDLDDTLLFSDGTVNYELLGLLIGLRINRGTKVTLITRHDRVVEETLSQLGITEQFDNVVHLDKVESKAAYVVGKNVVFVDDSYAERAAVAKMNPDAWCIGPESQRVLSGYLN
ncbi:ATP-grasp domain-containing protein [Paraburkholderia sp. IW21]|uniref:ATP-grasp domain-containing protein n=1 Tax=Paraburkholderia sp. IW21 TaxID=3242488 RepID=UPI0035221B42